MNTLPDEMQPTPKAKIAVIDVGFQAQGYVAWLKERTHSHIQVSGLRDTIEKAKAAALLQQKPDCVVYNPWGMFMLDPAEALVTHKCEWGDYTGLCYGVEYLETIQQLSPNSKVLICTEDLDREFVMEHGKRFENFSGYVHYSVENIIDAITRAMEGDIIAGNVPDHYFPTLKKAESFEALCEQTDLLALAAHQRRSPQHIYYFLLSSMETLNVRSFAEYKEDVLNMRAMVKRDGYYQFLM